MSKDGMQEDNHKQAEDADAADAREHMSCVVVAPSCARLLVDFGIDSLAIDLTQTCSLRANRCDNQGNEEEEPHSQRKLHSGAGST